MPKLIDQTGKTFGRLTVLGHAGKRGKHHLWECVCACGNRSTASTTHLQSGHTTSCGCFRIETTKSLCTVHGDASGGHLSPEYVVWSNMKDRCLNPKNKSFKRYGARGITICQRWIDSYEAFRADMGPRPDGLTLERKDNNGNYEPSNCIWANKLAQARNRRSTRFVTINGVTKCFKEWAAEIGIDRRSFAERVDRGWSGADLLKSNQRKEAVLAVFTEIQ